MITTTTAIGAATALAGGDDAMAAAFRVQAGHAYEREEDAEGSIHAGDDSATAAAAAVETEAWVSLPLLPQSLSFVTLRIPDCHENAAGARLAALSAVRHASARGGIKMIARASSASALAVLHALGFTSSNALVSRATAPSSDPPQVPGVRIVGSDDLGLAVDNWRKMWIENGLDDLRPDFDEFTRAFIARADSFKLLVALVDDHPVGSICCHLVSPTTGTIWAVYVNPEFRRRGIASMMVAEVKNYFYGTLGAERVDLIYASEEGCRVYKRAGWKEDDLLCLESSGMRAIDQAYVPAIPASFQPSESVQDLRAALSEAKGMSTAKLQCLLKTVPQQLSALAQFKEELAPLVPVIEGIQQKHKLIDKTWFENNLSRMGTGFDVRELSTPEQMSHKFDRLATKWDDFIAGCRYDAVFSWLCETVRDSRLVQRSSDGSSGMCVVDLCCGVGLPGQTIRLMDYEGHLIGLDISPGMLAGAAARLCYDELQVADVAAAASGLPLFPDGGADVVVCTGAMELMPQAWPQVLRACRRALRRDTGELWVSFQTKAEHGPTLHQGIEGVARDEIEGELSAVGLRVLSVLECPSAFVTPREGRLLDIPYVFYRLGLL